MCLWLMLERSVEGISGVFILGQLSGIPKTIKSNCPPATNAAHSLYFVHASFLHIPFILKILYWYQDEGLYMFTQNKTTQKGNTLLNEWVLQCAYTPALWGKKRFPFIHTHICDKYVSIGEFSLWEI